MNLTNDIKHQFRYGNAVMKLLLVNIFLFLIQSLVLLVTYILGTKDAYLTFLVKWFWVSSDVSVFITRPWTLFTYMFLHDPLRIFHILSNMIYLYFFGNILAQFFQHKKIYPLYLVGGIAGFLFAFLIYTLAPNINDGMDMYLVGPSAAVMAIVLAAAALVPEYSVSLLLIGPVKLKYIAVAVVIIDLISIPSEMNIAGHLAHLGGALTGYLYIRSYNSGRDWFSWWPRFENKVYNLFEPKKPKVVYRNEQAGPATKKENDITKQAKLDAILDKIKASGYDSLSKAEKEFLFKISNE